MHKRLPAVIDRWIADLMRETPRSFATDAELTNQAAEAELATMMQDSDNRFRAAYARRQRLVRGREYEGLERDNVAA